MRKFTSVLILAAISATGIAIGTSKATMDASDNPSNIVQRQPETIIDGQSTPEKIPDHEAYSILFRLIARRETDAEKNSIRSYLKMALGCNECDKQKKSERTIETENADIDAMIAAAEEFDQRVGALDQQATEVQDRYHPNHPPLTDGDREYLKQLQRQKESTAIEVAASLHQRLSSESLKNLRHYIKERMKRKIKMYKKQETG